MKFSLASIVTLAALISVGTALPHRLQHAQREAELELASVNVRSDYEPDLGWREFDPLDARSEDGYVELQARGGVADVLEEGIKLVVDGFMKLSQAIKQDKINRGEFTQDLVTQLHAKNPSYNYVVCHTKHTYKWAGTQGVDWTHTHKEFDIKIGGTIGYEIYAAKAGEFKNNGDGGFLNWAFFGNVKTRDQNGSHLVFNAP